MSCLYSVSRVFFCHSQQITKKSLKINNLKTQTNTTLLCRCSLTNQEPGTTTTTPTWPRKQVLRATVTPKMSCISVMLTLLHNVSCLYQHCVFTLSQVKRRWQMHESSILTLNKLVWDMSMVRRSLLYIFTVQMNAKNTVKYHSFYH